ncbi:MAG: DEAD/DEAH box helicase [Bacteroidetes bacterium]|nr:DEAD/DEAH box helicase [Bacteroidota bacterium]
MEETTVLTEPKKLYPYQENAVNAIFMKLLDLPPSANILFQLPTGGGKTIIFSEIAKRYISKFKRKILILTHRIELGKQTSEVLSEAGISNKVINSEVKQLPSQSQYQGFIALVETLNNRLQENEQFLEDIGLVIVDEAHNNSFRKIFHYFENVNILGVTATPLSSNKKLPLYQTYSTLIVGESIPDLISQGYLCEGQTRVFDVNLSSLRIGTNGEFTVGSHEQLYTQAIMQGKLLEAYEEFGKGKKTLIFNAGILTSRVVCETFRKKNIPIRHLDSTFSDKDRVETLEWFRNTKDAVLTSVSILTTGFDEPEVETIILNRATKSLTLYHQMIGRGSRVLPNKKTFSIIDLGNNSRRFNLWQYPIDWKHVFVAPHLYLEQKYKDEWDYELENDYDMPPEIKERFLNSSAEAFIVRDQYTKVVRQGLRPQTVIEYSLDDHFNRIKDNAGSLDEALELFNLLTEEMKFRINQFGKCINSTKNHNDYQYQLYNGKLRRRLMNYFVE